MRLRSLFLPVLLLVTLVAATERPAFADRDDERGRAGFDEDFYLYNNPDVADMVYAGRFKSGWDHYRKSGRREGRAPAFDEVFYLRVYRDVEEAVRRGDRFRSGWEHFSREGMREGRAGGIGSRAPQAGIPPYWQDHGPSSGFDEDFYLYNNPDVAREVRRGGFRSGRDHYDRFGRGERRDPAFNERFYICTYPDVRQAVRRGEFRDGFDHFDRYGAREGRAGGLGTRIPGWSGGGGFGGWNPGNWGGWGGWGDGHGSGGGWGGGRPGQGFDESFYRYNNPDVEAAIRAGRLKSGRDHYERGGRREGRGDSFDERWYLRQYPDVDNAVRRGQYSSGLEHFSRQGQKEGRAGAPGTRLAGWSPSSGRPGGGDDRPGGGPGRPGRPDASECDERWYLGQNPDVAQAVAQGKFASGCDHYFQRGKAEGRPGAPPTRDPRPRPNGGTRPDPGTTPPPSSAGECDDRWYLSQYPDIAQAVAQGKFASGCDHYFRFGKAEGRKGRPQPQPR